MEDDATTSKYVLRDVSAVQRPASRMSTSTSSMPQDAPLPIGDCEVPATSQSSSANPKRSAKSAEVAEAAADAAAAKLVKRLTVATAARAGAEGVDNATSQSSSVADQLLRLQSSVASDFVLISSAGGLVSPGRHAATFLPYGQEDHDLGVNWADTVDPLSRAWRGAASSAVPNATWYPPFLRVPPPGQSPLGPRGDWRETCEYRAGGDWRVPLSSSRFLPLPPAPDRPAYIQGLLGGQFGSYGLMAPPGELRQEADSSLPSPADLQTALDEAAAAAAVDEDSNWGDWENDTDQ